MTDTNIRAAIPDRPPRTIGDVLLRWETILVVLLAGVIVVNVLLSPYFLDVYSLSDASFIFSEQAIIAIPMALLILVREIDLSVAGIISIASLGMGLCAEAGAPVWVLLAVGLSVGAACGAVNGGLVTWFNLPSIVITIGTLSVFRGVTQIVLADHAISSYSAEFQAIGQGYVVDWPPIPISFALLLLFALVFGIMLHFTRYGRMLYAIGNNPVAARFSGLPVTQIRFTLFVITGFMSGVAAVLLTGRVATTVPSIAFGWELVIITMAVLGGFSINGGIGTIPGLLLAALVIGLITWGLLLANFSGVEVNVIVGLLLVVTIATPIMVRRMLRKPPAP
jgi:rhamnose transport system permease protein